MRPRGPTLVLVVAGLGAAAWAAFGTDRSESSASLPTRSAVETADPGVTADPQNELPPNHPPIGANTGAMPLGSDEQEPAAITWKAPSTWEIAQNPNTMRIATYHPPAAKGDVAPAEVIVVRAGGSVDANVQRWVGQFDGASEPSRSHEKIAGFETTFVEVSGAYQGGMSMNDPAPKSQPGWTLRGAIVETPGMSYFFKMIGPSATVAAARPAFDAMIHALKPAANASKGDSAAR